METTNTINQQKIDEARLLESLMEDRVYCETTDHHRFFIEAAPQPGGDEIEFALRFPSGRRCHLEKFEDLMALIKGYTYMNIEYNDIKD